jgi:HNH endonuclease
MAWEDIQGRCFPGYGRCIYCGSDGGAEGLRDEHVIPFALEGNTRIEKASCRDCERRISPVDTHLGRSVFGQHRIHAGVQTRRPKERPTILPANFTIGGESVSLDLPIKDHPYALALPVWGDAGFFRGAGIGDPLPEIFFHIYHWIPPNVRETLVSHKMKTTGFGHRGA